MAAGIFHIGCSQQHERGLNTEARGRKAFFYAGGLVEGFETIAFFVLMALFPNAFPALAWVFAGACVITAIARTLEAARFFRS